MKKFILCSKIGTNLDFGTAAVHLMGAGGGAC
jgi:hypothetical protein